MNAKSSAAWRFILELAPSWSTEYHVPIVIAAAVMLLALSLTIVLAHRSVKAKRIYSKYRTSKW